MNPPVAEAGQRREVKRLSASAGWFGSYTEAAIEAGAKLSLSRNRAGSYTAEAHWPNYSVIAGTGALPSGAIEQLERAIANELRTTAADQLVNSRS